MYIDAICSNEVKNNNGKLLFAVCTHEIAFYTECW